MKFHKYHALGNDYIVIDPKENALDLNESLIRQICHRNYGVGSDGILYGPLPGDNCFGLRIFNPDGSEAEKSGNGLRIFSRYLFDTGLVGSDGFSIKTAGGTVKAKILDNGKAVKVEMGRVSFDASVVPVKDETGEVINKEIEVKGRVFKYSAATIGNPHCVITLDEISPSLAREYGPLIENDFRFPNRTNVQFMKVVDRSHIQIEIWERGAGYTLASGSSSTACAAVAFKTGLCGKDIVVKMQGGEIEIQFDNNFNAIMTGPVSSVYEGELKQEFFKGVI